MGYKNTEEESGQFREILKSLSPPHLLHLEHSLSKELTEKDCLMVRERSMQ